MIKQCEYCRKEFKITISKDRIYHQRRFCEPRCRQLNWIKNHPEKYKDMRKREYWNHREEMLKSSILRYYKNKKKIKRICLNCKKEYIQNSNPKYCSKLCRQRFISRKAYWNNHEKKLIELKKYRDSPNGKMKRTFLQLKRQRKVRGLKENFSYKDWKEKLMETNGYCPYCDIFVGIENLTKDHIIPITKVPEGFVYTIDDVQPLCITCNSSKGNEVK